MKFMLFGIIDAAKAAEMAQVSDKLQANPPEGIKTLAMYSCQGIPFPNGLPDNASLTSFVTIAVLEAENNEMLSARMYPYMVAGASIWAVPVMDLPMGAVAEQEKRIRG